MNEKNVLARDVSLTSRDSFTFPHQLALMCTPAVLSWAQAKYLKAQFFTIN